MFVVDMLMHFVRRVVQIAVVMLLEWWKDLFGVLLCVCVGGCAWVVHVHLRPACPFIVHSAIMKCPYTKKHFGVLCVWIVITLSAPWIFSHLYPSPHPSPSPPHSCFKTIPPFVDLCALASPSTFSFTMPYCVCSFCLVPAFFFFPLFLSISLFFSPLSYLCTASPPSCSAACLLFVCGAPPTFASFPSVFPSFLPPSFSTFFRCLSVRRWSQSSETPSPVRRAPVCAAVGP